MEINLSKEMIEKVVYVSVGRLNDLKAKEEAGMQGVTGIKKNAVPCRPETGSRLSPATNDRNLTFLHPGWPAIREFYVNLQC